MKGESQVFGKFKHCGLILVGVEDEAVVDLWFMK